jgi:hypothetical protein
MILASAMHLILASAMHLDSFLIGPRHELYALGDVGRFIRSWNYDSFGVALRDRTSIAPRHVTPTPST